MHKVAIASRKNLEKHEKVFRSIVRFLKKEKMEVYLEERVAQLLRIPKYKKFVPGETDVDLVLVMGGDGTILRVVNKMKQFHAKFFGINMGHLGFLSEIRPVGIEKTLKQLFSGHYTIDRRIMLHSSVIRRGKKIAAFNSLNEVTITQGTLARLISLRAKVGGRKLTNYHADGLMVSTPTGSTAYNLAAGGPIVHPAVKAFIITPICSHSFTQKPIVIPDTKTVDITVASDYEHIHLTIDGQESASLKDGDTVRIKRDGHIDFIRLPNENYFLTLRQKLGWGGEN